MKIFRTRSALLKWRKTHRGALGFVPTMGALHEGHLSLVRSARKEARTVIASIFVNPTQFGPNEDFSKYPRQIEADAKLLESAGCDFVFAPKSVEEVYGRLSETSIKADTELSSILCGPIRPGHFDGVCSVVYKLFSWVRPSLAIFGEKDFQQLQIIKAMVKDLELSVKIKGGKLIRETSGLAMSSRNAYLTRESRERASLIYRVLSTSKDPHSAKQELIAAGFDVQYLECRSEDLRTILPGPKGRWLVAALFEGVRLIDNVKR